MTIIPTPPRKALNKAFLKIKPNRADIERFKSHFIYLLDHINDAESEEHNKNLLSDFLKKTYYEPAHFINTKGRNDLVIHNNDKSTSPVGVIIEAKKPSNKSEMMSPSKPNAKALQELLLYYLRERFTQNNLHLKHLIVTNIYEWYVFDASMFEKWFAHDKKLIKLFTDFENKSLTDTSTDFFYKQIAEPCISAIQNELEWVYFDIRDYDKILRNQDQQDDKALIALYKLLSPEHLLKLPFANDSNSLDKRFYDELLHLIGLTEIKEGSKKLIQRAPEGKRNSGSLLENAIIQLDSLDKVARWNPNGETYEERLFNVGLELSITWVNRILFLKLLEAQLLSYHKGDKTYTFLNNERIKDYDDLNALFFQVLARVPQERIADVKTLFNKVPYLNSSLFEPTDLEKNRLFINQLKDNITLPLHSATVLKDETGKKKTGDLNPLTYFFAFLDAYDFTNVGSEDIQEENKTLINASVLGLIFEKINGYKDGSFFTPGFITMYMARETLRKAVVQKFNEVKGWQCATFDDLYNKIEDRNEANHLINELKIVDPAVGSGHFLVSALNELIAIKHDLRILQDHEGKRLKEYQCEVVNDELIITDEDGKLVDYNPKNKESQRIQVALFHEKQTLIENCLFGVDINPNSVKICRLRLWIELLKHAYYKNDTELETLPNIDINIKTGNSLISRFGLDADLSKALKDSKWNIDSYKIAVNTYRNAQNKEQKRQMEQLIEEIKTNFRSEIAINDPKAKRLRNLNGELYQLTQQTQLFDRTEKEMKTWNAQVAKLTADIKKLDTEIEDIKANKIYENAFEWRFEFPEVLDNEGKFVGFDVVIGNPPYVDAKKLATISSVLKNNFEVYYSSSDLSSYFFELGSKLLKSLGHISYINTNKFFKTEYGKPLRQFISKHKIHSIVNFEQVPIFDEALVSSLIIVFEKNNSKSDFLFSEFEKESSPKECFYEEINTRKKVISAENINENSWSFSNQRDYSTFEKLYNASKKINQIDSIDIKRGLTTGYDPAFIIENELAINLNEPEFIKPLLKGKELKKYQIKNSIQKLIVIPKGYTIKSNLKLNSNLLNEPPPRYGNMNFEDATDYFKQKHKTLFDYLNIHKINAEKRVDKGDYWWELRACDYYNYFEREKIVWALTADKWGFALDTNKHYLTSGGFMMISDDLEIKYLLSVLNSNLMKFVFSKIGVMTAGGAFTLKKATIDEFPIKEISKEQQQPFIDKVNQILTQKQSNPNADTTALEAEIDIMVYHLYELTYEEVCIIDKDLSREDFERYKI